MESMADLALQDILTQALPTKAVADLTRSWSLSKKTYYDHTPPGETAYPTDETPKFQEVISTSDDPLVAVIGVGYVGEHLVQAFSRSHRVIGYDVSSARVKHLRTLQFGSKSVEFTCQPCGITKATHFLISVPTLLLPDKTIDSSFLRSALSVVAEYGRKGSTVVIESSVAVGMTRELLGPIAEAHNFFAGMSPERVDPGRTDPPSHSIPKVVSGLDDVVPGSLDSICRLYSEAFDNLVTVSRPEVAEMMKLYENCQRMLGIAYANEMADACIVHGIDPYEVSRAAATKPFGYLPFSPSLGVGGHCIPVNPYYLLANNEFPLLRAATEKMRERPVVIASRIVERLAASKGRSLRPRVLVVGMGFKPGQSHLVNSPGLELAKNLVLLSKVDVSWIDPLVKQEAIPQIPCFDVDNWTRGYLEAHVDLIVVSFRQHGLDFAVLHQLHGVEVEMWCS